MFDFTGTGPEVYGNLNAPPAVAYSAIIYSLRCLVTRDIPLNQGCLAPIKVRFQPLDAVLVRTSFAVIAHVIPQCTCCVGLLLTKYLPE
jgi:5-oxoprolinase (ATP-hydrolysing)